MSSPSTNRSQLDVIVDILELLNNYPDKTKITFISYSCNLNFCSTQKYLDMLLRKNLILRKDNIYCLTKEGFETYKFLLKTKNIIAE